MKICYVGDTHGDLKGMYDYLSRWQNRTGMTIDAVVQVGDTEIAIPKAVMAHSHLARTDFHHYWDGTYKAPIPTWVCPGNHDDFSLCRRWQENPDQIDNIKLMPNGGVTDILGIAHGSVWGNFSYKSWRNEQRILMARRNNHDSPKSMHILKSAVENLKRSGEFSVLITHDAPANLMKVMKQPSALVKSVLGLEPDEKAEGCIGFNELYETGKPTYHFFGHFHTYHICKEEKPLVVCLHCFPYNQEQAVWIVEF